MFSRKKTKDHKRFAPRSGAKIKKNKAFVTGINIVKKHTKPNPQLGITGGIVEQESPIDLSNIQIWDSKTKKGSRISMKIDEKTGKKERLNKKTGKVV